MMEPATDPRLFFESFVLRAYREFVNEPLDEFRAKIAVQQANIMAERAYVYWQENNTTKLMGSSNSSTFRDALAARFHSDFALVRDIDDAHKHFRIGRATSSLKTAVQTRLGQQGWDEGQWDEARWDSPEEIVVFLDDGTSRSLSVILQNVVHAWGNLLNA